MIVIAYMGYTLLVFIICAVVGTAFAAMKGQTNPEFACPGFILTMGVLFGLPCYLIGNYLRSHGYPYITAGIILVVGGLGLYLGCRHKSI